MENKKLNWAVLGVGVIANEMAQALQKMGKKLYAVGNRTYEKAVTFAERYGVEKIYDTIDEMFTDENVDINSKQNTAKCHGSPSKACGIRSYTITAMWI